MKILFFQIALIVTGSIYSQIPYFNIQIDNRQLGEVNGYKTLIETDSFYITAGFSSGFINAGAPHDCDTGIVVFLNKFDAVYQIVKVPSVSGINSLISVDDSTLGFLYRKNGCLLGYDTNSTFGLGRIVHRVFVENSIISFDISHKIDRPIDFIKTTDGGYAITGFTFGQTEQESIPILKIDSNFNQEFLKLIPPNPFGYLAVSIKETIDHGLLVVGAHYAQNNERSHGLIAKIGMTGNVVFIKEVLAINDTTRLYFHDLIRDIDENYIIVGGKRIDPPLWKRNEVGYRTCINADGVVLWVKHDTDDESDDRAYTRIKESLDGNYLLSGYDRKFPYTADYPQFGTISKMTPDGDILWKRRYMVEEPNAHYDIFQDVISTSDGGILVTGTTYANDLDSTRQNIWMMKLDGLGCAEPGCDTTTSVIVLPVGRNSPLKIFPNPTKGHFSIELQGNDFIQRVRVFDINGKLIIDQNIPKSQKYELDISGQPNGQYFVSAQVNHHIITRPIAKISQ